jgi:hypothetical protein
MSSRPTSTVFLGCLFAALFVAPVAAQDPGAPRGVGSISGRVIDATTARPISDVVVRLDGSNHETLSDARGMFTLTEVGEGEQRLVLEHLQYGEHARRVLVTPDEDLSLEARISSRAIELAPLVVETLTELDRRRITSGSQINEVVRDDLDLAQSSGRTLSQMLSERIPGASVRRGPAGRSCVEYRGARGAGACRDLTVFVDGVRIADPGSFYDMIPPGDIERMEILSVAEAGARYGSVSGNGVLLIETRRPPTRNNPDQALPTNTMFDWSGEAHPYAWKRVFATSFAANVVGIGLGMALADQCLRRSDAGSLGLKSHCGGATTMGIGLLSMAVPALGSSLAAQWGGATPLSQGRLAPTSLTTALGVASGYFLVIHGTGASEAMGAVVLGLGVPVLTTLADRIFRSHH